MKMLLLLANQYIDGATGEQKEKLEQQFSAAVEDFVDKLKILISKSKML